MSNAVAHPKTRVWDGRREGRLVLAAFTAWGHVADWPVEGTCTLGRLGANEAGIQLPSQVVSACHGELSCQGPSCFYRDLGSTNGTLLNGERCEGTVTLEEGDALAFAPQADPTNTALVLAVLRIQSDEPQWHRVPLDNAREVVFGRAGDVRVDDGYVSERHATFFLSSRGLMVIDLASTNGVFVNGHRVNGTSPVRPLDVVRIGSTVIVCLEHELWACLDEDGAPGATSSNEAAKPDATAAPAAHGAHQAGRTPAQTTKPAERRTYTGDALSIDIVEKNVWDRVRKKTLLKDFKLTVEPGDFVLVLGGSGAGKSTFINAVMGNDRAEGSIRLGDLDVYEEYDRIRYEIGYVPQQDLLRLNDSVWDTLVAAAQMRMPRKTPRRDCEERAAWAANLLGLSREKATLVGRLSGGQRKRLSIAVELVGDPSLFFLDEPDSGLDGIMARSLMENLRSIADLGKMVLVITHGPDRADDLFSKVLVLAKSERDGAGHMLFYGSVEEAKAFFDTTSLEGIVRRINRPDEGGEGLADAYLDRWEGR